ncbi:hypothetical protein E3N88_09500 [Mikania micrantha]|uniref:Uncharacterized protein n=1 Tax=Mikania micrantha TaxID=192012 RepID=A0A5N6PJA6_9ASTR|nr:hypothetical protein E3N88_09500 [Mikania micrantha]
MHPPPPATIISGHLQLQHRLQPKSFLLAAARCTPGCVYMFVREGEKGDVSSGDTQAPPSPSLAQLEPPFHRGGLHQIRELDDDKVQYL